MGERDTGEIERERYREKEKKRQERKREREIGRETGWEKERYWGEREGETGERERERERRRKKKITNTKKFMEFYLVVLQSGYHKILTIQSLYRYTAVIELTKIFKFGHPKSLLETFELSSRNNRNLIIVSAHKNSQFHNQSSVMTF